ncbi:MAG: RNA methyltransferase [Deltaproteobacteria bacterium]|jgi:tRNA G18 (ribose-2'-O)-methylase SpoU|nr:RNA methyltransferase [Deltaproteobacteria bacterium]MBW2535683.1 RNA methyltransferase [Deltaproteobacteria bacterium]
MSPPADPLSERLCSITSLDDPRVAHYRHVREADLVGRRGVFIAEGEVVLAALAEQRRYAAKSVLIGENRVDKLRPVLAKMAPSVPIYVTTGALMDQLAGFKIHRGVLAVGERIGPVDPDSLLDGLPAGPSTVVALEALTNHDNVGGIFRNANAFGAAAVLLDRRCCDPLYRKAIRVSAGCALRVPFARFDSTEALVGGLQQRGYAVLALSPSRDGIELSEFGHHRPAPERLALLLGTEGPGLSKTDLGLADQVVRVDIEAGVDSLNVATTAGIALHWFRMALHP